MKTGPMITIALIYGLFVSAASNKSAQDNAVERDARHYERRFKYEKRRADSLADKFHDTEPLDVLLQKSSLNELKTK